MISFKDKKDYVSFSTPIKGDDFEIVGYFPYETAGIYLTPRCKMPRSIASVIEKLAEANGFADNKITIICKDTSNFGTVNFAVHLHDIGCTFGTWEQVTGYANRNLK